MFLSNSPYSVVPVTRAVVSPNRLGFLAGIHRSILAGIFFAWIWSGWRLDAKAEENRVFGPFYSHYSLTLEPGERTEIAGPLLRFERKESEKSWAFSPIFFHRNDALTEYEEFDFVYPVLTYDRFG